ncbi:MAG: hypothetical protein Q8J69_08630 [Sphingobacteriaceae bacterium]|nr:hypothetical protein [Sphingobacteriaceae bacterium]
MAQQAEQAQSANTPSMGKGKLVQMGFHYVEFDTMVNLLNELWEVDTDGFDAFKEGLIKLQAGLNEEVATDEDFQLALRSMLKIMKLASRMIKVDSMSQRHPSEFVLFPLGPRLEQFAAV